MDRRGTIITCEHAGNYIPRDFKLLFAGHEEVLESHLGWDPGALMLAKTLSKETSAPLHFQKISRLLVENNRSLHHPDLFSKYSKLLDGKVKEHVLEKYYYKYRNEVEVWIDASIKDSRPVVHLSVHTFTPVLNGVERKVEIGFLYDESRYEEDVFCKEWKLQLEARLPEYTIMLNVPYNGADDGFTTYLRTKYKSSVYRGIELEVNQKFLAQPEFASIKKSIAESFECTLGSQAFA